MLDRAVSASDANRSFSKLLRDVQQGASYVVTAHGRPVARIIPFTSADAAKATARAELWRRIGSQPVQDIGHWTRDDLYD